MMMDTETEGLTRTAGRAVKSGRLRVGGIVRTVATSGPGTASKASIPSRFETILNTGPRERDAFWNRTNRFDDADNERPGPGSYRKPRTLKKNTPSVSKKGSGSFVSGTKIRHEKLPPVCIPPGPGQYTLVPKVPDHHAEHPASVFCGESVKRFVKKVMHPPGPGEYYVPGMGVHDPSLPNAVFRTRTTQSLLTDPPRPGPGDYEAPTAAAASAAVSVFKSTTTRSDAGVPIEKQKPVKPPPAFASQEDIQGGFGDVLKHMKAEDLEKLHGGRAYHKKEKPAKPSSAFVTNLLDRFGRPTIRYVAEDDGNPGPGQYDVERLRPKMLISSSWALSGDLRFREPKTWKPPGPAFYNVNLETTKVDHHVKRT